MQRTTHEKKRFGKFKFCLNMCSSKKFNKAVPMYGQVQSMNVGCIRFAGN